MTHKKNLARRRQQIAIMRARHGATQIARDSAKQ
jgi:hypothetical protein